MPPYFFYERTDCLKLISREEAAYLREHKLWNYIHTTSKNHKSRGKHYYAVCCYKVDKALEEFHRTHDEFILDEMPW